MKLGRYRWAHSGELVGLEDVYCYPHFSLIRQDIDGKTVVIGFCMECFGFVLSVYRFK